jgi:hypothetical protein
LQTLSSELSLSTAEYLNENLRSNKIQSKHQGENMINDVIDKRRDIPSVIIPSDLLAERRLQVLHSYFQWWIEILAEEYGIDKAKDLAIKWGRQKLAYIKPI